MSSEPDTRRPAWAANLLSRLETLLALDASRAAVSGEPPRHQRLPAVNATTLAEIEARLGISFPEDYRSFVRYVSAGGVGPDYGLIPVGALGDASGRGDADASLPARPFPLAGPFTPTPTEPRPPIPAGASLFDGTVMLAEIGCGYSHLLIVSGSHRGEVWADYLEGSGPLAPEAPSFRAWYEAWLDGTLRALATTEVTRCLRSGVASGAEAPLRACEAYLADAQDPVVLLDRALLARYFERHAEAQARYDEAVTQGAPPADVRRVAPWVFSAEIRAAGQGGEALERLSTHRVVEVRQAAAGNPAAPPSVLLALMEDDEASVRRAALGSRAMTAPTVERIVENLAARFDAHPDDLAVWVDLDRAVRSPGLSASTLQRFATFDTREHPLASWIVRAVAMHPALSGETLTQLATHRAPWVRQAVALNPSSSPALLSRLARDEDARVRQTVAEHPHATAADVTLLAFDADRGVIESAARHAAVSLDAIVKHICAPFGRYAVSPRAGFGVHFAQLSPAARACLELDPAWDAAYLSPMRVDPAALTPQSPAGDILAWCAYNSRATHHPGYPVPLLDRVLDDPLDLVSYGMADHPWVTPELLTRLATHQYGYTRLRVAQHPRTPVEVIRAMIDDRWPDVVAAVVHHPAFETRHLPALAAHRSDRVRESVASHPALDVSLLEGLARDPAPYVRRGASHNPHATPALLATLAEDPSVFVRTAVALRGDLDPTVRARLAEDPDARVKQCARWRLVADALMPSN